MDLSLLPSAARAALVALVAAAFLRAIWIRLRVRRAAARALDALGAPRGSVEGLTEGDAVTLVGELEATGPLCRRFEDGGLVAAASARGARSAAPVSARAERLRLVIEDRAVEIVGPIEVVVGAREERPGVGLDRLALAVRHRVVEAAEEGGADAALRGEIALGSLRSGDRVAARGVLHRGGVPAAGAYRDDAAPWVLRGDPAVAIAFVGSPGVRGPVRAIFSGLRDPRRLTAAVVVAAIGVTAAAALNALEWRPAPIAPAAAAKPKAHFGRAVGCNAGAARYAAVRDQQNHCDADADCAGEIRGEQWYELDGCFRFRNRSEPSGPLDALAATWFEAGCSSQYEVCSVVPQAMCRAGQCVERPPAPIPEDWVRQDIARTFTFFAPRDLKPMHGGGNCTGGLSYSFGRDDLSIYVDYDVDLAMDAQGAVREVKIGEDQVKISEVEKTPELELPPASYKLVAFFPEVPSCPVGLCFSAGGTRKFAMKLTAYGASPAACALAEKAIRTLRRW